MCRVSLTGIRGGMQQVEDVRRAGRDGEQAGHGHHGLHLRWEHFHDIKKGLYSFYSEMASESVSIIKS